MDKGRAKRFGGRKMIDQAITELVQYGLDTGLVAPEDKIFVTNQILEALGLESYSVFQFMPLLKLSFQRFLNGIR